MLYPWENIRAKRDQEKDNEKFNCQWLDEENKKDLPIGQDPCQQCADPNCPKRMKIYM